MRVSIFVLSLLLTLSGARSWGKSTNDCSASPIKDSGQVVLSIVPHWNSHFAKVQRFDGSTGKGWRRADRTPVDAVVGRNGLGWGTGRHAEQTGPYTKQEGDGRAPSGVFELQDIFGYDKPSDTKLVGAKHLPYHQSDENSRCVDDVKSKFYNSNVYDQTAVDKDWSSDEGLRRTDELYHLAISVNHNRHGERLEDGTNAATTGGGSCIFMHIWMPLAPDGSRPGTSGCTAMSRENLTKLATWADPARKPALVQLTLADYFRFKDAWCLPAINVNQWVNEAAVTGTVEELHELKMLIEEHCRPGAPSARTAN